MSDIRTSNEDRYIKCVGCNKTIAISKSGRFRRVISTPDTLDRLQSDARLAITEIQCYNRMCKTKTLIVRAK